MPKSGDMAGTFSSFSRARGLLIFKCHNRTVQKSTHASNIHRGSDGLLQLQWPFDPCTLFRYNLLGKRMGLQLVEVIHVVLSAWARTRTLEALFEPGRESRSASL